MGQSGSQARAAWSPATSALPENFRTKVRGCSLLCSRRWHANVMNTLDVYLGAALEVKLSALQQFSMDEYRARLLHSNYVMPCALSPSSSVLLLEIEGPLLFTMIDLLLGGDGAQLAGQRELTEIDEEVMLGVARAALAAGRTHLAADRHQRQTRHLHQTVTRAQALSPHGEGNGGAV